MPFHFALEPLLRLRRNLEETEKRRLERLHADAVRFQEAIASTTQLRLAERQARNRRMESKVPSAELQVTELHAYALESREGELRQLLERKREDIRRQILALAEARRMRETLESLRDRQLAEYHLLQNRKQQQTLDDMFLQRQILTAKIAR